MSGLAVIVELVGYALPFGIALVAFLVPLVVAIRLRRPRTVRVRE